MLKKIKDRLKILLLALSLIALFPALLYAEESYTNAELAQYLKNNDDSKTKPKRPNDNPNLVYKDQGTTKIEGTESSAEGKQIEHGTVTMDPEWEKAHDDEKIAAVQQVVGQMAQMPTPEMSDPRAEAVMGVTKNSLAAGAASAVAVYYGYKANEYSKAGNENDDLQTRNDETALKISGGLLDKEEELVTATNNNDGKKATELKKDIEKLNGYKTKVKSAMDSQNSAEWDADLSSWKNMGLAMSGGLQAGALAWTAAQSLDQAKKLGGEFQPPAGGSAPNQSPDGPQGPFEQSPGFQPTADRSPSDETTGFQTASDDNSLLEPASGGGFTNGADNSFLAASGDAFGSGQDSKEGSASQKGELSPKQYYDQATGSSGSYYNDATVASASSGFGGFDISQFLPAHLRGQDDHFLMKTVNGKDKGKESLILGKDSPSLFTRISKAHQKKAHELGWEL